MLFDPRPKEKKDELFNREEELEALSKYVSSGSPIILCLGIRRIGKTSVLKVFLNENNYPSLYIDARRLSEIGYSKQGLYRLISEEFTRIRGRFASIIEYLRSIKGVSIAGHGIELNWRDKGLSLSSILIKMDDYARDNNTVFLIVIDEAQYLRFLKGHNKIDFRQIIAYTYDNLRRVKFILAGSEIGMLYRFLGFNNPSSPLYGRVRDELLIERFSREESIEFLKQGFSEANMSVPEDIIEEVVDLLDGIVGWLAYFGYKFLQVKRADIVKQILEEAINMALNELKKLNDLSPTYSHVLRAIALNFNTWSTIKRTVEAWMGRTIPSKTLYRILSNLIDMSIIDKKDGKYVFLDPIYKEASRQL